MAVDEDWDGAEAWAHDDGGHDGAGVPPPVAHPMVRSALPAREPLAALSAWSVLEALSPRTYTNPRDLLDGGGALVRFTETELPWAEPAEPRQNYAAYYRVGLGSVDMRGATRGILQSFGWDEGTVQPQGGRALLGMILLDSRGAPVASGTSVSSFGWALPLVLGQNLSGMVRWGEVEEKVVEALNELLCVPDPEVPGKLAPLSWGDVDRAHRYLLGKFGVPEEFVEGPGVAFGFEQRIRPGVVPQPYLLNSFLLGSIEKAHGLTASDDPPMALGAYMGLYEAAAPVDVLGDRKGLSSLLSPGLVPPARWPAPGGNPLVTLQQAAVNAVLADPAGSSGLTAVNGPPGTGKTTMIRDVAAGNIIRRAKAMASADDPETMFEKVKLGGGRTVYVLDRSLRGFEMLVASSNNKAVENVSRELPLLSAVDPGAGVPRYFRTTSDFVAGISLDPKAAPRGEGAGTWGLMSAALGNSGNRSAFMERFWWNEDHGIRTWLRIAKGEDVKVAVKDGKGNQVGTRAPYLLRAERVPKGRAAALRAWREVRGRFEEALREVERRRGLLTAHAAALAALPALEAEVAAARAGVVAGGEDAAGLALRHARATTRHAEALAELERSRESAPRGVDGEPGAPARVMWEADRDEVMARVELYRKTLETLSKAMEAMGRDGVAAPGAGALAAAEARLSEARREVGRGRPADGASVVDDAFFDAGHEAWNLASPWMGPELQDLRARLFGLAMEVHEAFALAAAVPMLRNLAAYSEVTGNGSPGAMAEYAPDLWSTLFLVVPVVSTTFASVGRMLDGLPPASLGWLIVDEAGQATPQAAVGALAACRRALFVGDPLQVEPVTTLPGRLVTRICDHFGVEPDAWVAPNASAQTLADRASPLKATFSTGDGERDVGMPLLVHRRCQEPMFGISNRVAYAGQMVHAAGPGSGRVARPSAWFDVTGPHEGKWCEAEGEFAAGILRRMAEGGRIPDAFFISPFREVAANLRRRLATEASRFAPDGAAWARDRVGTVHTFQGREAASVVLVLGAGGPGHGGARKWAGRTPNIANVAVTRAKERLYVVGSLSAWGGNGAFAAVADALPSVSTAKAPRKPEADPDEPRETGLRSLQRR